MARRLVTWMSLIRVIVAVIRVCDGNVAGMELPEPKRAFKGFAVDQFVYERNREGREKCRVDIQTNKADLAQIVSFVIVMKILLPATWENGNKVNYI